MARPRGGRDQEEGERSRTDDDGDERTRLLNGVSQQTYDGQEPIDQTNNRDEAQARKTILKSNLIRRIDLHQNNRTDRNRYSTISTDSTHFLRPLRSHSVLTDLILSVQAPSGYLSSAALNENDLSVEPIGLDLGDENFWSFRKSRLIVLDVFRGSILCLQALETSFTYLGRYSSTDSSYLYWHQHVKFPFPRIDYSIRTLTMVCTPALHFLLGVSSVLSLNTRRRLGWRSFELVWRSFKLCSVLLILNQILMIQGIVQSHGKILLITTPIWSLGWNLLFITITMVSIFLIERSILSYILNKSTGSNPIRSSSSTYDNNNNNQNISSSSTNNENNNNQISNNNPSTATTTSRSTLNGESSEEDGRRKCSILKSLKRIERSIDYFLISSSVILPLIIGYMLPGQRLGPDQDWYIDWAQTRSFWFWFFVSPTPDMKKYPRFKMITNYSPLGWFPFVIFGSVYGRIFLRKKNSRLQLFLFHFKIAFYFFLLFLFTRVFDIGNFSTPELSTDENNNFQRELKPSEEGDHDKFFDKLGGGGGGDGGREGDGLMMGSGYLNSLKSLIRLMVWFKGGSSQIFFFTSTFPPDLSHFSLNISLIFSVLLVYFLIFSSSNSNCSSSSGGNSINNSGGGSSVGGNNDDSRNGWIERLRTCLEFNPLIQFGRSPIFFYSIQLLSFHYVLPMILKLIELSPKMISGDHLKLNLITTLLVDLICLPIFWLFCETFVILKDRKPVESVWRFL